MACKNSCRLCDKLILSTAIAVSSGNLVVTIPAGNYGNMCQYCIVLAQNIPSTATVNMPVVIQIGTGTQFYNLVDRCCRNVTVCGIRNRTRYKTVVETTPTTAVFKMLGNPCCQPNNNLKSVNGTAPTTTTTGA